MAILPGDWPINASTTSGNDLADKLNRLAAGTLTAAGGTLVGPLLLHADPATALGAATKQYVDAKDATLQNGIDQAKADAASAASSVNAKVSKTGDLMTGALRLGVPDGGAIYMSFRDPFGSDYARLHFSVATDGSHAAIDAQYGGAYGTMDLNIRVGNQNRMIISRDGNFYFYGGNGAHIATLDTHGNFTVKGNITAFGI